MQLSSVHIFNDVQMAAGTNGLLCFPKQVKSVCSGWLPIYEPTLATLASLNVLVQVELER